jgi:hypothetical protein
MDRRPIQQLVIASVQTTIQVNTNLPTYVLKSSTHQPSNEKQPRDSPEGSLLKEDLLGGPPFNPPIGSFKWPTPNPRIFIPP